MSERRVESDCNCNTIYATENYPQIFNKLGLKILKSLFCSGNHMNSRRVMYFDADFSKNSRTLATIKQQAAAGWYTWKIIVSAWLELFRLVLTVTYLWYKRSAYISKLFAWIVDQLILFHLRLFNIHPWSIIDRSL